MPSLLSYQSIFLLRTLCMKKIQQLIYIYRQCTSHKIRLLDP
jgi:hypothetical protein